MQLIQVFEFVLLIELFFIFSVTSLHHAILIWLPCVDEIVDDVMFCTEYIQRVEGLDRHIASFIGAGIEVGESGVVVGFDGPYVVLKSFHDNLQEPD